MQAPVNADAEAYQDDFELDDAFLSAVSWPAIFAGGLAAVALSLTLLILGSGLGFAAVSPWSNTGASAGTIALSTVVWLIIMQWASAGIGGYITGRLRTRWLGAHPHEVFFRDTAHGFLTWALASVLTAVLFVTVVSSIIGGVSHAAMHEEKAPRAAENMPANPIAYYVDSLFRQDQAAVIPPAGQDIRMETARILVMDLKNGTLSGGDRAYISKLVTVQAGVTQEVAGQRIDSVMAQINADKAKVKDAADKARKASASLSIFTALAMFIGAFIACLTAALGGKCRDDEKLYGSQTGGI